MRRWSTAALMGAAMAACAAPDQRASQSAAASLIFEEASSPTPMPEASPTVRIVIETPMPTRESYEDEAAAIIRELTESPCQVVGTSTLLPIDVSVYADEIAALPDRTGWLDEPWTWVGSTQLLAEARHGTLVGEADIDAWFVFTDAGGEPRAESYWAYRNEVGDVIWWAKDSIAATPCPPDVNVP